MIGNVDHQTADAESRRRLPWSVLTAVAQGNSNAPALNEDGLPNDEVAIAEDVIGANEDETQG